MLCSPFSMQKVRHCITSLVSTPLAPPDPYRNMNNKPFNQEFLVGQVSRNTRQCFSQVCHNVFSEFLVTARWITLSFLMDPRYHLLIYLFIYYFYLFHFCFIYLFIYFVFFLWKSEGQCPRLRYINRWLSKNSPEHR